MGVFLLIIMVFLVIVILLIILYLLINVSCNSCSNIIPYECGFNSLLVPQVSFSVHFFLLLFIFVVFDLELVFLIGFTINLGNSPLLFISFFFLIFFSYYLEFYLSSFNWEN